MKKVFLKAIKFSAVFIVDDISGLLAYLEVEDGVHRCNKSKTYSSA